VQLKSGSTVTGWHYINAADDSLETYGAYGKLSSIAYRAGTAVTMTYATGTGAPTFPAQLLSVTDSFGRKISFGYVNNLIHTMTDANGGIYSYSYSTPPSPNVLSSVTYPDTYSKTYLYNESAYTGGQNFPYALTGVNDENSSRYDSTWYGTSGAAIKTALAGGVGQYSATNTLDGTGRIQSASILTPLGATLGQTFASSVGSNLYLVSLNPQPMGLRQPPNHSPTTPTAMSLR
jgi:hypothetical protein